MERHLRRVLQPGEEGTDRGSDHDQAQEIGNDEVPVSSRNPEEVARRALPGAEGHDRNVKGVQLIASKECIAIGDLSDQVVEVVRAMLAKAFRTRWASGAATLSTSGLEPCMYVCMYVCILLTRVAYLGHLAGSSWAILPH